jgi:hypothetical protein
VITLEVEHNTLHPKVNGKDTTALSFQRGELLELDIRDVTTSDSEQFPPGGIKLTVGRDM